jgi:signal transduction histidine kinase
MKSMRRQLVLALVGGMLAVAMVVGVGLYIYIRNALISENDTALAAKAQMAAGCVHLEQGSFRLAMTRDAVTEFSEGRRYFQIWRADGGIFARSPSLGGDQLVPLAPTIKSNDVVFSDITLPNGHMARAVLFHFVPLPDDADDIPRTDAERARASAGLNILAARDRAIIDARLDRIIAALVGGAMVFAAGLWAMFAATVRRNLRPLSEIADQATRIDANSLQLRFPLKDLPVELVPICARFNDLLGRLDAAFNRERRFTADVAHELRTPIAELRSLAEVAVRWPGDSNSAAVVFGDALDIARHMERMVTTLLTLSRCDAGRMDAQMRAVDVGALVRDAWSFIETSAAGKKISAQIDVPEPCMVKSDPALLASIVSNLLGNAVEYAIAGSTIGVRANRAGPLLSLSISNLTDSLSEADLPHIFEPFWQKDSSRSHGEHSGLGLALVKAYSRILGVKLSVALSEKGVFSISLDMPAADETPGAATQKRLDAPSMQPATTAE